MTEGTTRLLETPERPAASFDPHVYEQPGSLAQPTSRMPSQANETSRSLEVSRKSPQWVLIGSILIAVIALTALFVILLNRPSTTTPVSPPAVTRPELPPIPPPPPVPPPGSTQGTTINRAFVYPGAETTMEVTSADEGNVLQLQTSDSFDKVVDWYTAKLKPTKVVRTKDPTSNVTNVILEAGELKAIITANGNGTTIMLAQEDE